MVRGGSFASSSSHDPRTRSVGLVRPAGHHHESSFSRLFACSRSEAAARLVLDLGRQEGAQSATRVELATSLVVRSSTGVPPTV